MNKRVIILLFVLGGMVTSNAQVEFNHIESAEDMEQVWADASARNMPVFVDIYATWCGPCKWMDANVFATEAAGKYMNEAFINVKMDGESQFGRVFAMKSGLSAYPSFFLFNSSQDLMNTVVGAKPWEELQVEMAKTLEYYPVLEVLQSKFESGLLNREEYPRFTNALREMGKDEYGKAVGSSYVEKFDVGDDWSEEDIRVLAFYIDQRDDDWERLVADIPELQQALGDDLERFIDHVVTGSIEIAVENRDLTPIKELGSILPELAAGTQMDPVEIRSRMHVYFYHYTEQFDRLSEYIETTYMEKHEGDHKWLFNVASDALFLDPRNEVIAKNGLDWFQTCIDQKETHEYYYHLALCQYLTGDPTQAVETLNISLEFTNDPESTQTTKSIIKQITAEAGL